MTSKALILILAWFGSLTAAFLIGRAQFLNPETTEEADAGTSSSLSTSTRSNSRSSVGTSEFQPGLSTPAELRQRLADIAEITDPVAQTQAYLDFVRSLSSADFEAALDTSSLLRNAPLLGQNGRPDQVGADFLLMSAWAQQDPLAAIEYAQNLEDNVRDTVLASWASTDAEAAIAWAKEKYASLAIDEPNPFLPGIIRGLSESNLPRATELLLSLPYSSERGQALRSVLAALEKENPNTARSWAEQLSDPRLQAGAVGRLSANFAQDDPEGTLSWAASISQEALAQAAPVAVKNWLQEDQEKALSWLDSQPRQVRSSAATEVVESLPVDEAEAFLANSIGDESYDRAMSSLSRRFEDDPARGAQWVMNIQDNRLRNRTFHRNLRTWQNTNPEALREYAENHEVPEGVLQRLGINPD